MAQIHPAWLERQRRTWLRPDWERWMRPDWRDRKYWAVPPPPQPKAADGVCSTDGTEPEASGCPSPEELRALQRSLDHLRWLAADLKFELAFRRFQRKYSPDQPRVPAGNSDGGQWTSEGGGSGAGRNDPRVLSDATSDNLWTPGAQYAQNISPDSNGPAAYSGESRLHVPPGADIDQNMQEAEAHKSDYLWFYNQVHNKGAWDYKQIDKQYEDFGNFNYGATGRAAGFSEETLLRAAGWAQVQAGNSRPEWGTSVSLLEALLGIGGRAPFGDDPRDQFWILQGFKYYDARRRRR